MGGRGRGWLAARRDVQGQMVIDNRDHYYVDDDDEDDLYIIGAVCLWVCLSQK